MALGGVRWGERIFWGRGWWGGQLMGSGHPPLGCCQSGRADSQWDGDWGNWDGGGRKAEGVGCGLVGKLGGEGGGEYF